MLCDFTLLSIGCGGTFWAASPLMSILNHLYSPKRHIFIDPDYIEEDNFNRQWFNGKVNSAKAEMSLMLMSNISRSDVDQFSVRRFDADAHDPGGPVLAIVNVDNNQARLEVREWLANRIGLSIMIVTGCRRDFGQCYYGVWNDMEVIHDWLTMHPDVADTTPDNPNPCGGQTIVSNALTGQLIGLALEEINHKLPSMDFAQVSAWYWRRTTKNGLQDLSMTTSVYKGKSKEIVDV